MKPSIAFHEGAMGSCVDIINKAEALVNRIEKAAQKITDEAKRDKKLKSNEVLQFAVALLRILAVDCTTFAEQMESFDFNNLSASDKDDIINRVRKFAQYSKKIGYAPEATTAIMGREEEGTEEV